MIRLLAVLMATLSVLVLAGTPSEAGEKAEKEVTLKGNLCCAKCELGQTTACANAIVVKEKGKDVVYLLKDKGAGAPYHGDICQGTKAGSVRGVVSKQGDKLYITPAKDGVKFD
jgi:hypothetical protein